jgi:hypothetical protein
MPDMSGDDLGGQIEVASSRGAVAHAAGPLLANDYVGLA